MAERRGGETRAARAAARCRCRIDAVDVVAVVVVGLLCAPVADLLPPACPGGSQPGSTARVSERERERPALPHPGPGASDTICRARAQTSRGSAAAVVVGAIDQGEEFATRGKNGDSATEDTNPSHGRSSARPSALPPAFITSKIGRKRGKVAAGVLRFRRMTVKKRVGRGKARGSHDDLIIRLFASSSSSSSGPLLSYLSRARETTRRRRVAMPRQSSGASSFRSTSDPNCHFPTPLLAVSPPPTAPHPPYDTGPAPPRYPCPAPSGPRVTAPGLSVNETTVGRHSPTAFSPPPFVLPNRTLLHDSNASREAATSSSSSCSSCSSCSSSSLAPGEQSRWDGGGRR
jgi:hypothetical protein